MHPDDAASRGLADGDAVSVTSDHGAIDAVVELDDDLMPGVVSMVHGWGHAASPRLRVAAAHPGAEPQRRCCPPAPAASNRCPARRT